MSDSWPAPPRPDEPSDSLVGKALEVERALKALEAMDAFRAEAAALRAELHAVRASGAFGARAQRRRSALPRGRDLPEGAWRLAAECAVIVAVAGVAWAVHLSRVGILLALGGTWLVVAVFEAVASRTPVPTWVQPPPLATAPEPVLTVTPEASAPAPAPAEVAPEPAIAWPSRLEPVEAVQQAEPDPEPQREPEAPPAPEPELPLAEVKPDDEPFVAVAAPEDEAEAVEVAAVQAEAEPEPEPEPLVPLAEVEPDGGPSVGAFATLEEGAEVAEESAPRASRWWHLFRRPEQPPVSEAELEEPLPEPEPEEDAPEAPRVRRWWQVGREPEEALSAPAEPLLEPVDGALAGVEEEAEVLEAPVVARRRWWQLFAEPKEPPSAEPEPAQREPERVAEEPQAEETFEEDRQWDPREETPALALSTSVEPTESEVGPETREPVLVAEVEPDGGPAAGAYAMLEEHSELRMQEAAPHQTRWWQLFGDREKPAAREAAVLEPVALVEPSRSEPAPPAETHKPAISLPAAGDPDVGWPSRFDSAESDREPVFDSYEPVYTAHEDTADLLANDDAERPGSVGLFRPQDEPSVADLEPIEPEADSDRKADPELYLVSHVEPDGGPSLGAFAVLVEAAELSERPAAEPIRRSRFRLLFRRR